ncbi:MAG: hypothetical protein O2800_00270 [Planctomycetota bacterium]|nr:hypothetical protein [Planctomycetota bacterium]
MRQFAISARHRNDDGSMPPIGRRDELLSQFATINTYPESVGSDQLFAPGVTMELPSTDLEPTQILMSIDDEDIAWPYIMRLVKTIPVRILDVESGRELGAS